MPQSCCSQATRQHGQSVGVQMLDYSRVVGSVMVCTLLNLLEKMVGVVTESAVFNIS
jgi:hypothetical protein